MYERGAGELVRFIPGICYETIIIEENTFSFYFYISESIYEAGKQIQSFSGPRLSISVANEMKN